jgi:uncharacterized protein (TIGR00725 family)
LFIGVVGPGQPDAVRDARAETVGRLLAEAGAVVVCGGLGGVMAAACRGASSAGGTTVGLLPGDDRRSANPWVTVPLPTGLGELRNGLVVRAADALVAVGGGYGTLSEMALALKTGCPVVGLDAWPVPAPIGGPAVVSCPDPAIAVSRVLALARNRRDPAGDGRHAPPEGV